MLPFKNTLLPLLLLLRFRFLFVDRHWLVMVLLSRDAFSVCDRSDF